ncbi:uncharacterized protein LOC112058449 isoform X2 [Bicyclus anynana]|uniref:Uncharacterized protein LOC112058449 isoform X2 n=1 Tax=Bicyclus anynana TaxID=110368 RepID=A0ABM3M968_BICAN|nr:uncharacterized protein LOC112058449 isoform X2 [Bicyclus anynana]
MEENSVILIEDDGGNIHHRQVTEIHGNVETTIVVEEVKEEDTLMKSKSSEAELSTKAKLSLEKDQPETIVISPSSDVPLPHNKDSTSTNSTETKSKPTESQLEQKTSKSATPPKSVQEQKTTTKLEPIQMVTYKPDQVQKPPNKIVLIRTPPKSMQVQKAVASEQVPKNVDQVQKTPTQAEVTLNTPKKDQTSKTPPKTEQTSKTPPKTEQTSITPPKTEQTSKTPPKTEQTSKTPPKTEQTSKTPPKTEQTSKTPPKTEQTSKTPPKTAQVQKLPAEVVNKKLDQFKKYLGIKTPSNQEHKSPEKTEQVQNTSEVGDKLDQAEKISEPKLSSISVIKPLKEQETPINISEQQKSGDVSNSTKEEAKDSFPTPQPSELPEAVSNEKPSIIESKPTKESVNDQELPKETIDKPESENNSEKPDKSLIKESLDQQNIITDGPENTDALKETIDKSTTDKNELPKDVLNSCDINEKSNDSHLETNSDEKDRSKSISRELKSLIKSAKESKIISECTQLTSKTRKSRATADSTNTSLNTTVEADKIQNSRRSSINSQESNCSEKSEKTPLKRSMRSQNPEFVNKVKQFLNSVTGKNQKDDDEEMDDSKKDALNDSTSPVSKKKKLNEVALEQPQSSPVPESNRLRSDLYCWRCHYVVEQAANEKGHPPMLCTVCPRSFHYKCLSGTERNKITNEKSWICLECYVVLHAESSETRSPAMKKITLGQLSELLRFALERMMDLNGVEPFMNPVDRTAFPDYEKYVVHPMDLSLMKKNLSENNYGSPEAFLADAMWILHNSIIFNTLQSKLTGVARALVRSCRAEMGEIEACPECYMAAHARRPTWFTDVCSTPHMLLWAKLKGIVLTGDGEIEACPECYMAAHARRPTWFTDVCSTPHMLLWAKLKGIVLTGDGEIEACPECYMAAHARRPTWFTDVCSTPHMLLWAKLKGIVLTGDGEIEACPECYMAAHARRPTWFTDVCSTPHMLLWAKLKGFPYWPAKGMSVNSQGLVDVRFFGAHDRAWVPARDCFLYCEKDPNNFKAKRTDILESMQEAEDHIRNISRKYGQFKHAPFKTPFDPTKLSEQLKMMIPTFDGEVRSQVKDKPGESSPSTVKERRVRSNSKSSKSSINNEGEFSENDEGKAGTPKKVTDDTEVTKAKGDFSIDKQSPMEVDEQNVSKKEKESSRKRRRSGLEEAVITIMSNSKEKKKKVESEKVQDDHKSENAEETTKDKINIEDNLSNNNLIDNAVEKTNDEVVATEPLISKEVEKEVSTSDPLDTNKMVTSTPIKVKSKVRSSRTSTPKEKEEKAITPKHKPNKSEKTKHDKQENVNKQQKRSSRNRSHNSSELSKEEKVIEKKNNKDSSSSTKDKIKDVTPKEKVKEIVPEPIEKIKNSTEKSEKLMQIDDNTSLAALARESAKKIIAALPTITSVRSLSTTAQSSNTTTKTTTTPKTTATPKTTTTPKTVEITVSASSALNVFTPTSSDNVRNMKEAVDKLQKLRTEDKPKVGRVGVRSFARMTSPPAPPEEKQRETVEVEVKSEPMDFDDADRQVEKMDLMKAFQLRPVNPVTTANLRDVRINKVVISPVAQKAVTKTTEVRIRARKTFPQPRKDKERSELNGKNSMVYIPIQPPTTQAPTQRTSRPVNVNGNLNTPNIRPQAPTSISKTAVNTQITQLSLPNTSLTVATSKPMTTVATNVHSNAICVPNAGPMPNIGQVPIVGQVPTTVHTVPLITSVNGQWTFSLQPMMSVGGDGTSSPPVVNGLAERNPQFVSMAPTNPLSLLPTTQLLANNNNSNNNNNNNNTSNTNNTSDNTVELPRLQQRPPLVNPLDPSAPAGNIPVPSTAGPVTAKLSQNAVKLADFFRNLLEDTLEKMDDPVSQATILKAQLEQSKWKHQQEVNELMHTYELMTTEMRVAFEKEKTRTVSEMRRVAQVELEAAVKAAKTKQWCANCSQEAQFYCCWNTSYCDYSCQRSHWTQHYAVCAQQRSTDNTSENGNVLDRRLQPGTENLPALQKNAPAPALTVGTKITPTRVFAQPTDGHPQKTSIIVSMVEDPSGNQMVKCVGSYKTPGAQQVSPLLLNKQLMNDENAAKKVMTSGGYLIVGAGNSAPMPASRRNLPVQYTYNT